LGKRVRCLERINGRREREHGGATKRVTSRKHGKNMRKEKHRDRLIPTPKFGEKRRRWDMQLTGEQKPPKGHNGLKLVEVAPLERDGKARNKVTEIL